MFFLFFFKNFYHIDIYTFFQRLKTLSVLQVIEKKKKKKKYVPFTKMRKTTAGLHLKGDIKN